VVEELKRETGTPVERLNLIINTMVERMCAGLAMEGGSRDYKMIVTYVDELPSGYDTIIHQCLNSSCPSLIY
jgi:hexokinase